LTKHLVFSEKKYIELPEIKIKNWNTDLYEKLDIDYLKSRFFIPESLLNEALMLGYGKAPVNEYKELIMNNRDKDIIDWSKILVDVYININHSLILLIFAQ
jgi:hypothetical protein